MWPEGENHMKTILTFTLSVVLGVSFATISFGAVKNVVLVHGAFADGSGWKPVADILEHNGYVCMSFRSPRHLSQPTSRLHGQFWIDRDRVFSWDTVTAE